MAFFYCQNDFSKCLNMASWVHRSRQPLGCIRSSVMSLPSSPSCRHDPLSPDAPHMHARTYIIARRFPALCSVTWIQGGKNWWRMLAQLSGYSAKMWTAWRVWSVRDPFLSVYFSLGNWEEKKSTNCFHENVSFSWDCFLFVCFY